jgi:hypothetical protein
LGTLGVRVLCFDASQGNQRWCIPSGGGFCQAVSRVIRFRST